VVEVEVHLPDGAEDASISADRATPLRYHMFRDGENRKAPYWGGGEINPASLGTFPFYFSCPEAEVGDTLAFSVELVLSDSSVVRWNGPPGSDRPAPTMVVRRGRRVGFRSGLVIAAIALIPLLTAGVWKAQQRGGHAK
jgi:hypothetical protein